MGPSCDYNALCTVDESIHWSAFFAGVTKPELKSTIPLTQCGLVVGYIEHVWLLSCQQGILYSSYSNIQLYNNYHCQVSLVFVVVIWCLYTMCLAIVQEIVVITKTCTDLIFTLYGTL